MLQSEVIMEQKVKKYKCSTHLNKGQNPRKRHVHPLHCVRQLHVSTSSVTNRRTHSVSLLVNVLQGSTGFYSLFGHLLYVVSWTGIVGNLGRVP